MILEVDDHRLGRDFVAGIGLGVERRREASEIHRLASADLGAVQVRDKSVVVLHVKHQVIQFVRVADGECVAQVERHVLVTHIVNDSCVVIIAITDTDFSPQP